MFFLIISLLYPSNFIQNFNFRVSLEIFFFYIFIVVVVIIVIVVVVVVVVAAASAAAAEAAASSISRSSSSRSSSSSTGELGYDRLNGKLVRHMQNLLYTYDEYLICIGLGPSISSVICKNLSYSGPSYPS